MPSTRIFIGNLSVDVQEKDIKERFSSYGDINKIDLKSKFDIEGKPVSRFAYINLEAEHRNLNECVQNTNGSNLKGSILKVEIAKESFLDRLKREREQTNQPRDVNSYKAKNNEISFNYNFEHSHQSDYNKKEYNFNYNSQSSNNLDNYDKFDNSRNFEDQYDNNENYKNTGSSDFYSERDNNNEKRKFGFQSEDNEFETFPSLKRYYPSTSENLQDNKSAESQNKDESRKGFVSIYSKLSFKEEGSSFSLLDKFSAAKKEEERKDINEELNAKKKVSKLEQTHSLNNRDDENKTVIVKPKSRNFFVSADDPMFEGAVEWILTPLTEENQKEFEEARSSLLEVNRLRLSRARRDDHLKGSKTKFARVNR